MKEAQIQKRLQAIMERRGAWVMNVTPGGGISTGTPDLVMCYRGRFIALEVKQPRSYPTAVQRYVIKQIQDAGGVAEVVRSEADLVRLLNNL